jgi:hypothetical protein
MSPLTTVDCKNVKSWIIVVEASIKLTTLKRHKNDVNQDVQVYIF